MGAQQLHAQQNLPPLPTPNTAPIHTVGATGQQFQSVPGQGPSGNIPLEGGSQQQTGHGYTQDPPFNPPENEGESCDVVHPSTFPDVIDISTDELQTEQRFRDVLQFIANRADVNLSTPVRHLGNTRVHLRSEQFTPKTEFVSLTTTEALQQLVQAWWGEFKRRDITPTSQRANKLFALFKNSANKASLKPYLSADTALKIETLTRPTTNLQWLPQTCKKSS